jgi:hypothetical protein
MADVFPCVAGFRSVPRERPDEDGLLHGSRQYAAPTKNTNRSPITGPLEFNVYDMRGTPTLLVGPLPVATFTTTPLAAGDWCWAVTAIENGRESAKSDVVSVTISKTRR